MRLSEKAMLISLNISQWTARKKDKHVTRNITAQYGADEKAGTFSKALIAKEHLAAIAQAATDARSYHYKMTLPWMDSNGVRILPTAHFSEYSQEMRNYRSEFESRVNRFLDNYPQFVDQARYSLNGLFREEDYPDIGRMCKKFSFETDILPVPDASDFRVQLQHEDLAAIKRSTEARLEAAQAQGRRDIYARLAEYVGRMAERLSGEKNVFRDTLVENLRELVDLIPGLNITGDPKIEEIRQEVAAKLTQHSPQMLREHKPARRETAQAAKEIMDKMGAYFG